MNKLKYINIETIIIWDLFFWSLVNRLHLVGQILWE